jgi:hypothetical protein
MKWMGGAMRLELSLSLKILALSSQAKNGPTNSKRIVVQSESAAEPWEHLDAEFVGRHQLA